MKNVYKLFFLFLKIVLKKEVYCNIYLMEIEWIYYSYVLYNYFWIG